VMPVTSDPPVRPTPPVVARVEPAPRFRVVTVISGDQEHQITFREETPAQNRVAETPAGSAVP